MAQTRTSRLAVLLVAPLLLAGCGGAADAEPVARETTTVTATPTPSASTAAADDASCTLIDNEAQLVVNGWDRVLASRGAADHGAMIDGLAETIEESVADHDGAACSAPVELSGLGLDVATLRAMVLADPDDDQAYVDVAAGGNEWVAAIGASDVVFAAP